MNHNHKVESGKLPHDRVLIHIDGHIGVCVCVCVFIGNQGDGNT